jgi:PAS domain-containing protein
VRLEGSGSWYVLRALPYVTSAGAVDGVVVTFTDVTALKRA